MRNALLLAALLACPAALAAPTTVPLQGTLRDNAGALVGSGSFAMTFALYDASDASDALWVESWNGFNEDHLCHSSAGEIVWFVR